MTQPPRPSGPKRPPAPAAAPARPSNPAARPPAALAAKVKDTAADTALNTVAVVKEGWRDFLRTDRYFKLKALIVALWAVFAGVGLYIAWPDEGFHADEVLGARLVVGPDPDHPVYMIVNEGDKPWKDVVVTINGQFRATVDSVEPGKDFSLTPKQLVGRRGKVPPPNLQAVDLVVRTKRGQAVLIKNGELQ